MANKQLQFSAIDAMAEVCTWGHRSGEEGHLIVEASNQNMPPEETEPQAGKGLAIESITIQEMLGIQGAWSMGFKEESVGRKLG